MKMLTAKSGSRAAKGYTIGRQGFAKISAIEGIQITAAMDAEFHEFERKGLSAAERRKVIAKKYGKVR
jgi:hypothetical protein